MQVADKVFVVTGGGNGIGRAVVAELLERGAKVVAVDLRDESLEQLSAELSSTSLATIACDITDREAVHALPAQVSAALGPADAIVNVAGIIQPFVVVNELGYDAVERVMNVNFWGTLHMIKAFLPGLLERPEASITNVGSMGGFLPVPGQAIYGASKAAVKLMTEGLYAELLDTSVAVSMVFPGAVGTNITTNSGVDMPMAAGDAEAAGHRMTSAESAATTIVDGLVAERFHILVGRDAKMMYRLSRLMPRRATHLIQKQMKNLLER